MQLVQVNPARGQRGHEGHPRVVADVILSLPGQGGIAGTSPKLAGYNFKANSGGFKA